jgi:hypothetical protein
VKTNKGAKSANSQDISNVKQKLESMKMEDSNNSIIISGPTGSSSGNPKGTVRYMAPDQLQVNMQENYSQKFYEFFFRFSYSLIFLYF